MCTSKPELTAPHMQNLLSSAPQKSENRRKILLAYKTGSLHRSAARDSEVDQ